MAREYPAQPLVGLGAVVWHQGRVLMIRRGKPPRMGGWSLPGGAQQLGETAAEGVRREIREETGIEIHLLGLVDVVDSIQRDPAGQVQYHYTIVDFAAIYAGGELQAGDDAIEAVWVTPEDLSQFDLWAETLQVIQKSRRFLTLGSAAG